MMAENVRCEVAKYGAKWRVKVYRDGRLVLVQHYDTETAARAFADAQEWAANNA